MGLSSLVNLLNMVLMKNTPTTQQRYQKLSRLGRNLRPGDEILVSENLGTYKSGRVRVVEVRKGGRAYFSGAQEYLIFHSGPCAGDLTRHLWTGDYWGRMTCEADDRYDILRPIAEGEGA